jgi:hypothetical protein
MRELLLCRGNNGNYVDIFSTMILVPTSADNNHSATQLLLYLVAVTTRIANFE